MLEVNFWKFSSAGNTTLFVDRSEVLLQAMSVIGAEQAGYPSGTSLEMAGGELCINACLAFAAFLQMQGCETRSVFIAGEEIPVEVSGSQPEWLCRVKLNIEHCSGECIDGMEIRHLPGISHSLLESVEFPQCDDAFRAGKKLREQLKLDAAAACGIIWWRKISGGFEIMPLISVPGADTCNIEAACGSGSIALALGLPAGRHHIRQPSGESLSVEINGEWAIVECPVHLLAQGRLWIGERS